MDRSTFLLQSVIDICGEFNEENVTVTDRDETIYNEDLLDESLRKKGFDPEVVNAIDEHRNNYLAAASVDFGERSNKRFKEDENLQERRGRVYLGKYDNVNLLASRSYEDSKGETINNHVLIEHNRENNLLESVQTWVSAIAGK